MLPWALEKLSYRVLPAVEPGRMLAAVERRTLTRVAEAMIEDMSASASAERVADSVERFFSPGCSRRAARVRALLTLIEWLPFVTQRRRFSDLSVPARRELIATRFVAGEHLWTICAKVRLLVAMSSFANTHARATSGS